MTIVSRSAVLREIEAVLEQVREAQLGSSAHPFLPVIEESLVSMHRDIRAALQQRAQMAGALGRIVTDDFSFSESALGTEIIRVAEDFAAFKDSARRRNL